MTRLRSLIKSVSCAISAPLALLAACAPLSQGGLTAAERQAIAQAPLSERQIARRNADCALELEDGPLRQDFSLNGVPAREVMLPPLRFLKSMSFLASEHGREGSVVGHPLPHGGVGPADICGMASVSPSSGAFPHYLTARLRDGLDLQARYPASAAQIRADDLIIETPAGKWLVWQAAEDGAALLELSGAAPFLRSDSVRIKMSHLTDGKTYFLMSPP